LLDSSTVTAPPAIEFRKVTRWFQAKPREEPLVAVQSVSLSIASGEVVSLIGPSGCGKSTLLNMGAGLFLPNEGEVFVAGAPVRKPNPQVAFMLQKDLLMPWRTIRENAEFGLQLRRVRPSERRARAQSLLERCHLAGFEDHYPHQLSGGMRQRAALARTLVIDPMVLLLDEPFSAVDAQTKMILQQDLAEMVKAEKKTALFITHDLLEAVILSDRILVMSDRPGTIVEEIRVNLPSRDDPLARRSMPEATPYVSRLMSLLHISGRAPQRAAAGVKI
jgi:NitT/TauT family transport system ATP-binding protein